MRGTLSVEDDGVPEFSGLNRIIPAHAGNSPEVDASGGLMRLRRIIPAHAGNSRTTSRTNATLTDHPRACGELVLATRITGANCWIIPAHAGNSLTCFEVVLLKCGSSPRMRGTLDQAEVLSHPRRIIPAHAGNSVRSSRKSWSVSDHPRACGELLMTIAVDFDGVGSSPRMRGTRGPGMTSAKRSPSGSSPRMRGTPFRRSRVAPGLESDHPRACGELPV